MLALAVVLILCFSGSWKPLLFPSSAVDSGSRTLVVISTSGGERDYETMVNARVDEDGERFTLFVRSPGLTTQPSSRIAYRITAAGPHGKQLRCPSLDRRREPFEALPRGVQTALSIDAGGGAGSATNFAGADVPDLAGSTYTSYAGKLVIGAESAWLSGDSIDREWQWSVQCTLPRDAVWRQGTGVKDGVSGYSLLVPQVNLVGADESVDHQTSLDMWTFVDRKRGAELAQSYPPAESLDAYWRYHSIDNEMALEGGTLWYTDQPTLLFQPRDLPTRQAQAWGIAGLVLGIGGSLAVSWLVMLVKLLHGVLLRQKP
ncbi:hypothetical protein ACNUCX_14485 [Curtobacterium flaccumfaciens pv. flaccumfaciens]|uniref:hypothetical protein n=1 Tax=Curtobacterium flaccumfaciens TaxID=2035 RepID=UPI003AB27A17